MNYGIKSIRTRSVQIAFAAALACLAGSAFADQTHVPYSLAGGASLVVSVPGVNTPVQMSCTQNTIGNVGEGQATIIRSTTDELLDWVGIDYFTGAISRGFSATAGTHIIWCDFAGEVDIEVSSAGAIKIVNASSATQTGVIMFVF